MGDQIERILGITKTEYEQEAGALLKFVHPDDVAKIIQKAGTLKNKKAPQQFVYRFQHQKTKEYLWLEERVTPQFDNKGKHVGNFGITTDVTDRILAEQAIKKSEERFRMMAENAMDVIYRYTIIPHARYEYISPSIFKMSGYTPEEFYEDPYIAFKIIHPDDIHIIGDAEVSLKEKNKINSVDDPSVVLRWIKKDGSVIWTETKTQNVFNEVGEKIAIEGITRDVTEQKQSVENYKSLVDFTPDGVMIHVDGFIKFANPSALKMIGAKSFDEIENKSSFELILPEYHNQLVQRIKSIKQGEELDFAEIKIKTLDNKVLSIETKPIAIKFNGIDAIQVVFHDVTAQKQLMREQLRAQIAEETNQNLQKQISERLKAESELKEAQKFTRLIIESSIDMICASDKDGYITEFNQAALDTLAIH
ncbi:MAG: PAS domain S-box protein [Bacteroidetes bacterium]|nr:PAS domain S-box protein [Bacteroidota bacterium]